MACLNNMHQLGMAHLLYADENHGRFPERREDKRWPTQLRPGYRTLGTLRCPEDRRASTAGQRVLAENEPDTAVRSYIINGWNDVLERQMTSSGETFNMGTIMNKTINESVIVEPSETIVYGEKLYPIGHFFMDLLEGNLGNDNEVLNHAVHNSAVRSDRGGSANGGSNFAFADGSTRYLRYRKSLSPINLWAITPQWRTNTMN